MFPVFSLGPSTKLILAKLQHEGVNIMQIARYGAESGISQPPWGTGWLNPIRVVERFGNLALPGRLWRSLSTKLKSKSCMEQDALLLPQDWELLIAVAVAELEAVEGSPSTTPIMLYKDIRRIWGTVRRYDQSVEYLSKSVQANWLER